MTSKTLSLVYKDITLYFVKSWYFKVAIVKLSLRSVNFWLFKLNLINKNLRCGNRTEVNHMQTKV